MKQHTFIKLLVLALFALACNPQVSSAADKNPEKKKPPGAVLVEKAGYTQPKFTTPGETFPHGINILPVEELGLTGKVVLREEGRYAVPYLLKANDKVFHENNIPTYMFTLQNDQLFASRVILVDDNDAETILAAKSREDRKEIPPSALRPPQFNMETDPVPNEEEVPVFFDLVNVIVHTTKIKYVLKPRTIKVDYYTTTFEGP